MEREAVNQPGSEALGRGECLQLLRCGRLGQLVLSLDGMSLMVPAHYAVADEETLLVRIGRSAGMPAMGADAVVGFKAVEVNRVGPAGWSVSVTGVAEEMSGPEIMVALLRGHLPIGRPPADAGRFFRVSMDTVAGRSCNRERRAPGDGRPDVKPDSQVSHL